MQLRKLKDFPYSFSCSSKMQYSVMKHLTYNWIHPHLKAIYPEGRSLCFSNSLLFLSTPEMQVSRNQVQCRTIKTWAHCNKSLLSWAPWAVFSIALPVRDPSEDGCDTVCHGIRWRIREEKRQIFVHISGRVYTWKLQPADMALTLPPFTQVPLAFLRWTCSCFWLREKTNFFNEDFVTVFKGLY